MAFFSPTATFNSAACKQVFEHNLVFLQNQQPGGGCYMTTWSLAVTVHYWMFFPLALVALQPQVKGFR